MKVFVDTSVWINYLKGHKTNKTKLLGDLIETGQAIYSLPVVIQEILQGFKHDKDSALYADIFEGLNFLTFEFEDAIEAARLYRNLRKSGITPTTIDLQIAAICLKHELHLLTEDKGFSALSAKLDLALA